MSRQPASADAVVIESRAENGTYIITWSPDAASEWATARDLGELRNLVERHGHVPHRVFLDLTLPIRMGVELLRMVKEACPNAGIVARVRSKMTNERVFSLELHSTGLRLTPVEESSDSPSSHPSPP